jgi:hypothetical protein
VVKLVAEAKLLGSYGASKGGFARAEKLSAKELSKQGSNAVNIRWSNRARINSPNIGNRARTKTEKA